MDEEGSKQSILQIGAVRSEMTTNQIQDQCASEQQLSYDGPDTVSRSLIPTYFNLQVTCLLITTTYNYPHPENVILGSARRCLFLHCLRRCPDNVPRQLPLRCSAIYRCPSPPPSREAHPDSQLQLFHLYPQWVSARACEDRRSGLYKRQFGGIRLLPVWQGKCLLRVLKTLLCSMN
jgi:hypothetical protein